MSEIKLIDNQIYLEEDRFAHPKELFKFIGDMIESVKPEDGGTMLDVGCATGEFLYYIGNRFSDLKLSGFDISVEMIERAKAKNSKVNFLYGNLLEDSSSMEPKFDIVSNIGVVCFFDEVEIVTGLQNLLASVKEGGSLFIHSGFNPYTIDVIMKYRRINDSGPGQWEGGWNIFSRKTIEQVLRSLDCQLTWSWHPWEMPFALEKRDDPMRSWTIKTEDNPFQRVNGANQLVYSEVLQIRLDRIGG